MTKLESIVSYKVTDIGEEGWSLVRTRNDPEFYLVVLDSAVGNDLATALEVRRADILCGIATREARRLSGVVGSAGAPRHTDRTVHDVRD